MATKLSEKNLSQISAAHFGLLLTQSKWSNVTACVKPSCKWIMPIVKLNGVEKVTADLKKFGIIPAILMLI